MRRKLLTWLTLIVLMLALVPRVAMADALLPYDWGKPIVCSLSNPPVAMDRKMVGNVTNRFDAALAAIGRWVYRDRLTTEMRAKLTNEGTGGAFYEVASGFVSSENADLYYFEDMSIFQQSQYAILLATCGANGVWFGDVSSEQQTRARQDLETIVHGGSVGGGGGGAAGVLNKSATGSSSATIRYGGTYDEANNTVPYFETSQTKAFEELPSSIKYCYGANSHLANKLVDAQAYGGTIMFVQQLDSNNCYLYALGDATYTVGTKITFSKNVKYWRFRPGGAPIYYDTENNGYVYIDNNGGPAYVQNGYPTNSSVNLSNCYYSLDFTGTGSGGGGGGDNWPDPDPPSPPTPPDPDPPTPPEPDPPTPPDPPDPIGPDPTPTPEPEPTTWPDYVPWLRAILNALNDINESLASHCSHITESIEDQTDYLTRVLQMRFNALIDNMAYELEQNARYVVKELADYLHDLFEWLVENLDFTFEGGGNDYYYDDSSIVGWLRKIYYKMGGERPSPVVEPEEDLDWWSQLLQWIASKLNGIVTDFVGDVGGFLNEIAQKYPFSIPYDVMAILTLLDAQRAIPVVTVTIPAITSWWNSFDIVVDLTPYDEGMSAVRTMELILWCLYLAMKTDWLGGIFDSAVSSATGFVDGLIGKVTGK